jgi:AraC family transcriptional regulator
VLYLIRDIRVHLERDVSLRALSKRAGWSPYHLQRSFQRAVGETPRRFVERLRLERVAAQLMTPRPALTLVQIARASGFASPEVFTRAFRRHFGCTPQSYRKRASTRNSSSTAEPHAAIVEAAGPCIRLFHYELQKGTPTMPTLSIERTVREAQPILLIRRRLARSELQSMLAECFGKLSDYGAQAGLAMAGWPLARYLSTGPGLWTVEAAMPLAAPATGEGEIEAGVLEAGPVAVALHAGPYAQLPDTYAALERWMEGNGAKGAGAPWEWYVNDPGEFPDPKDWRTEVHWPLEK